MPLRAMLGIAPIAWWNGGLPDLNDDGSLGKCPRQAREAHTRDVRRSVIDGRNGTGNSVLDAVVTGAFTVPGDGSLDSAAIVGALHANGNQGWLVVEAEQAAAADPPLEIARRRPDELVRVMKTVGCEVVR